MRRWFLLLLVLLLPLRGWVGEVMAGDMLQQRLALVAVAETVAPAARASGGSHADCLGHAAVAMPDSTSPEAPPAPADCATCASCQVCSSVALATVPRPLATSTFSQAPPDAPVFLHASAEPLPAFKPPIS